jgi:hypothetical protein
LNITEFERLLEIGLGRTILFLKANRAAPYRDVIMHACLHNLALDKQIEGSRAGYMLDVIEQTGEKAFYRHRILSTLSSLTPNMEDDDVEQIFDFARLFALQGDPDARQAIYTGFLKSISLSHCTGAATIIDLEGIQGFLYVASRLGEVALRDPAFIDDDY